MFELIGSAAAFACAGMGAYFFARCFAQVSGTLVYLGYVRRK